MSLQSLLSSDSATLERPTITKDSSGGSVRSWTTVDSDVAGRIEDLSAKDQLAYMQKSMVVTHYFTTQNGNGRNGDRWLTSDSRYLLIQGSMKVRGMGGIDTYYEYQCEELRPGA